MVGTLHVQDVLDALTPDEMDGWEAYDAISPIGSQRTIELLADLGVAIAAQKGVEATRSMFLPWLKELEREKSGSESLNEVRRNLKVSYGA